jgi:hypothetical protein
MVMSRPMFIPLRRTSAAMNLNLNARALRRQFWVALAVGVIAVGALHNLARSKGGPPKKTAPINHQIVLSGLTPPPVFMKRELRVMQAQGRGSIINGAVTLSNDDDAKRDWCAQLQAAATASRHVLIAGVRSTRCD